MAKGGKEEEAVVAEPVAEPAPELEPMGSDRRPLIWRAVTLIGGAVFVLVMLLVSFNVIYAGQVYPGVAANGVYLGGADDQHARKLLASETTSYSQEVIELKYDGTSLKLGLQDIDLRYDTDNAAQNAMAYGRQGNPARRLLEQLGSLLGRRQNIASFTYDDQKMAAYTNHLAAALAKPVKNAGLSFEGGKVSITPSQAGTRLDSGRLVLLLQERLAELSPRPIAVPADTVEAAITAASLSQAKEQAKDYVAGPLRLKFSGRTVDVTQAQIVSWLKVEPPKLPPVTDFLAAQYPASFQANLAMDTARIAGYVADLAAKTDQKGQDAALTIADGRAVVFRPSRDGVTLDQEKAVEAIKAVLPKPANQRELALEVKVFKPAVREESLNDLGIKELISEGISYFPGSGAARMQNIRVGAAKYNGVLVKPGDTFSFGEILGEVSAATGYAPARVILGNRQEEQYGGGLCQVSSTSYRAALMAGLPILQRTNHSYAVSYYTTPYGVPGVDATIYYPQVDFKFKNDTPAYILIQTVIQGTTLKFQFYGTKVKEGRIRGPFFVSGDNDATKPSHTVFYRDVVENGQVVKTDTVNTYYKSSNDFPVTPQYN